MNHKTKQQSVKLICCVISLLFFLGALSSCSKKPDPFAKTGITSVVLDDKERI